MKKKLTESTVVWPIGRPNCKALFRVPQGQYAGRLVALYQPADQVIELSWADAPFTAWSLPQQVVNDCKAVSFDCVMDEQGNITIAYIEYTTGDLVSRKLSYSLGSWTPGSTMTIHNSGNAHDPSLAIDPLDNLWVSWTHFSTPNGYVHVKSSTDGGLTWGTGPADAGDILTDGAMFTYLQIQSDANSVHVVYSEGGTQIAHRSRAISGGSWSSEFVIASGTGFSDRFDSALTNDGLLAVVFVHNGLKYREFDSTNWGAVVTLETGSSVSSPQVFFRDRVPVAIYLLGLLGTQQGQLRYTDRSTGTFFPSLPVDGRATQFDNVVLYDKSSQSYADLTSEAANSAAADVYHPSSNVLLKNIGDECYFGMTEQFRFVEIALSTVGAGGSVGFRYWDGSNWNSFAPVGGGTSLDTAAEQLLLWDDYSSAPNDWQRTTIAGENRFWIKMEVVADFTTGPIGSRATAISYAQAIRYRR
jgi:hypothetical protein